MSSKVGTAGLLRPSSAILTQKSSPVSESRAQSKERHRKAGICLNATPTPEANSVASITTSTTVHTTTVTTTSSTTTSTSTATSSKPTSSSANTITMTPTPTIIKTAPPNKPCTGSPILHHSALPHSRAVSGTTSSSSSNSSPSSGTRGLSNSSTTSNNQNRSSSNTTTHLSPWSGPTTTYTSSNSINKKTSATADSRLVVLGSPAVGKSALVVRLLTGRFIWEYDPTLEAAYRHHTTIDDDSAVLDILDTAGQSEGLVNEGHARWGDGFLLTFSLTDRSSFNAIKEIHDSVASARQSPNFSCVVVANKTDLGHLAEVSGDEASELAGDIGASLFLTSACDGGPTIQAAFSELHRDVIRRRWTRRRRSSAKTVIEGFYKMFSR